MAKSVLEMLIEIILKLIFDEEWKGKRGEKLTERELKKVQFFGRKGKVLRNVYIPKDNGETSEIDLLFITQKGIFVFESKNYSGWIFGNEKSKMWMAMLPNGEKNQFYNPIMQNRTHIKWIKNYLEDNIPLFSIIVFSERCEIQELTMYSEDIKVINRDETPAAVKYFWEKNTDVLSEEKIEELYQNLKKLTNVDASVKAAHIDNIEKKYKNNIGYEANNSSTSDIKKSKEHDNKITEKGIMICPQCGKTLVLRTAKKGANIGKQFYGCSGFPNCRYIQNL